MNLYDLAYSTGLCISAPVWLLVPKARKKVFRAMNERMGQVPPRDNSKLAIMLHAVSLGEINATSSIIEMLRQQRPGLSFVVSTTTDTGYGRGQQLYSNASDVMLIRFPLDFGAAVKRVLDQLKPAMVVLMELEVWPNFVLQCVKRNIPVMVANGRISTGSFKKYKMARSLIRKTFGRLSAVCAQDKEYQQRFIDLGTPEDKVCVCGTLKFDTAKIADRIDGDSAMAAALGLRPGHEKIWVCGSTGPGEEQIILRIYRELLADHARLRLVIVPRKPERFDEVAQMVVDAKFKVVRRSNPVLPAEYSLIPPVVLGDTMGELRMFYSLADLVFVGRTLLDLGSKQHGSDMIEHAALAKPVIVGPFTGNFNDVMRRFNETTSMRLAHTAGELKQIIAELLLNPKSMLELGQRAQKVVKDQQGSTAHHVEVILNLLRDKSQVNDSQIVQAE